MNPGVIDVQNSHKRACQPGDGWIFAGGRGGGRPLWRGLMELGDQSSHRPDWSPQDQQSSLHQGRDFATNDLAWTETCLMIDVIRQHARRHKKDGQFHSLLIIQGYLLFS